MSEGRDPSLRAYVHAYATSLLNTEHLQMLLEDERRWRRDLLAACNDAGHSCPEIARALKISKSRVHQLVDESRLYSQGHAAQVAPPIEKAPPGVG